MCLLKWYCTDLYQYNNKILRTQCNLIHTMHCGKMIIWHFVVVLKYNALLQKCSRTCLVSSDTVHFFIYLAMCILHLIKYIHWTFSVCTTWCFKTIIIEYILIYNFSLVFIFRVYKYLNLLNRFLYIISASSLQIPKNQNKMHFIPHLASTFIFRLKKSMSNVCHTPSYKGFIFESLINHVLNPNWTITRVLSKL
jgi:hypothetical protein